MYWFYRELLDGRDDPHYQAVFVYDTVMSENGHSGGAAAGLQEMDFWWMSKGNGLFRPVAREWFLQAIWPLASPARAYFLAAK